MLAHSELLVGTACCLEVQPHQWCKAIGIRCDDSPDFLDAIATNLTGKNPGTFILAAMEESSRKIAGYVFVVVYLMFVVGHLKVGTEYERPGVVIMLLAVAEIHAYQ